MDQILFSLFYLCIYFAVFIFFSSNLLNLFSEIHYWDQLGFEIPTSVYDIYQNREDLRSLREETLLLARDYNRFNPPANIEL